ncbi:right-handed parallel beta-helix repeat-containing protein [Aestuariivirga sp.]|uniref:right-handed parallel beta-helix repeat-containing protein n=1 Tax=Aestuariivirga sp. TaxID=2650926 RepID=UPI0039E4F933
MPRALLLLLLILFALPARADDTAALQATLDAGKTVTLEPDRTYHIRRSLAIRHAGTGIIGDGTATLVMDSDAGAFDNASASARDRYGPNAVGIIARGIDRPIVQGVRITYAGGIDDRYVKAIAFRDCTNIVLDHNEAWNFTKSWGILYIGGSTGGSVSFNTIRDSTTNSFTFGQITGIEFDNDDKPSSQIRVEGNDIHDLTVGPQFLKMFGYQTDGINTVRQGTSHLVIVNNRINHVGEAIDHFGNSSSITGNRLSRCYNFCIKLIHGARFNFVRGNQISGAGLGGIVLAVSAKSPQDTLGNVITGNVISGIDPDHAWAGHPAFGIGLMSAPGAAFGSRNNRIIGNLIDLRNTGAIGLRAVGRSGAGNCFRANIVLHARIRATWLNPSVANCRAE